MPPINSTTTPAPRPPVRMTPKQASQYLGCSERTLAVWRCEKGGPKYFKLLGRISYAQEQLDEFLNGGLVDPRGPKPKTKSS